MLVWSQRPRESADYACDCLCASLALPHWKPYNSPHCAWKPYRSPCCILKPQKGPSCACLGAATVSPTCPALTLEAAGDVHATGGVMLPPPAQLTCCVGAHLQGWFVLAFVSSLDAVRFCHAAQAQVRLHRGFRCRVQG